MLNRYYKGPVSDHFDGTHFFNPDELSPDKGFSDILKWRFTAPKSSWPQHVDVQTNVPEKRVDHIRTTMVGHATVLIQVAGLNILTDPVWSDRASPLPFLGPKRVVAPGIAFEDLPPIDIILLSHNHYDHMDIATLRKIQAKYDPLIITPLGNDTIIRRHIPKARIQVGDWGDKIKISEQADVHIVPANHWSARGIADRRMALWGGFVLRVDTKLIYFAGDTGYGTGSIFKKIYAQFGAPDLALIPIGAYDPRWFMSSQHVDPEEAIQIMCDLHAKAAVAIHWGAFKLTDEAREDPANRLAVTLKLRHIASERFQALKAGEVADFN